jgi:hypothetical protein
VNDPEGATSYETNMLAAHYLPSFANSRTDSTSRTRTSLASTVRSMTTAETKPTRVFVARTAIPKRKCPSIIFASTSRFKPDVQLFLFGRRPLLVRRSTTCLVKGGTGPKTRPLHPLERGLASDVTAKATRDAAKRPPGAGRSHSIASSSPATACRHDAGRLLPPRPKPRPLPEGARSRSRTLR